MLEFYVIQFYFFFWWLLPHNSFWCSLSSRSDEIITSYPNYFRLNCWLSKQYVMIITCAFLDYWEINWSCDFHSRHYKKNWKYPKTQRKPRWMTSCMNKTWSRGVISIRHSNRFAAVTPNTEWISSRPCRGNLHT